VSKALVSACIDPPDTIGLLCACKTNIHKQIKTNHFILLPAPVNWSGGTNPLNLLCLTAACGFTNVNQTHVITCICASGPVGGDPGTLHRSRAFPVASGACPKLPVSSETEGVHLPSGGNERQSVLP